MMNSIILQNLYQDVLEISDKEMQKSYWLEDNSLHVSSYNELMNRLFDDDDLDGFIERSAKSIGFSETFLIELNKLRTELNDYDVDLNDSQIIADPRWTKIVDQAKVVITLWDQESVNLIM